MFTQQNCSFAQRLIHQPMTTCTQHPLLFFGTFDMYFIRSIIFQYQPLPQHSFDIDFLLIMFCGQWKPECFDLIEQYKTTSKFLLYQLFRFTLQCTWLEDLYACGYKNQSFYFPTYKHTEMIIYCIHIYVKVFIELWIGQKHI